MHERITGFLQERVDAGDFPSAVYLVAEKGEVVFHDAVGYAVVEPEQIPAKVDTIYDLASLTKVLVTGLLAAAQIEEGDVNLEFQIGNGHPIFGDSIISSLTIKDLVTHTSGLPAWRPLYLLVDSATPNSVEAVIRSQDLAHIRTRVEYSDLNFISLALLIEGTRPDTEFDLWVARNLGLKRSGFNPISRGFDRREIAASEKGNEYEKQTCIELGYITGGDASVSERSSRDLIATLPDGRVSARNLFRDYQIWGEVHDGNAWFMGGVAGHAGLFSTAEEVFKIGLQFLPNYTTLLKPETTELFRTNFTEGMNEDRSFAFQLASTEGSTAGTQMPPESYGHNGFTGTSLWVDPVNERIFILLTNRTHARPLPFANINSVRRRFHDLAIELL